MLALFATILRESLYPETNLKSVSFTLTDEAKIRELIPGKLPVLMPARSQK